MTKDEALKLALEALEGIHPGNMTPMAEEYWNKAITAIKQALAASVQKGAIGAEYQKSPWDGKGISMPPPEAPVQEPVLWLVNGVVQASDIPTNYTGCFYTTPPAAPDLQAELDATNRQVEILSDALAESRREIDAVIALARADERESCAKVCDRMAARCNDIRAAALESAAENIRARGNI
jgi:hypothetical protein